MGLDIIKGNYDAIFSLGDLCLAAIQLRKLNLRPYAGVIDWMGSPNLSDVNRMLQNRFSNFMQPPNLQVLGYASEDFIYVKDHANNVFSNHDFRTDENTLNELRAYPQVIEKYNRRIQRFLHSIANDKRILFVRTEGTFPEALELENTLRTIVTHDFRVLLINHTDVDTLVEKAWPLEKICAVDLPDGDKWNANDHYWEYMLDGVYLN